MNKVLNKYEDFGKIISTLSDRNMSDDSYYVQYVLSPYMQALGYDVFDIDETERMFNGDTYKVKGFDPDLGDTIYFIFSLGDYRSEVVNDYNVRAYILFDKETKSLTLYYYVLDEWYSIYETRLLMDGTEDISIERDNLVSLNKVISKHEFQATYGTLGERLFTGSVVDSLLASGDLENRFVRQALVDELVRPDSHMIKMLASKLTEYSTQESEWLEESLADLQQTGLVKLLETAIGNSEIEIIVRPKAQPLPSAVQNRPKKQSEVATDIGHKADKLKKAGFSTENLGKATEEVKEEKPAVKDAFNLDGLKDQLVSSKPEVEPTKALEDDEEVSDSGLHDIGSFFGE